MFTMLSVNDMESIHTDTEVYNIKVLFFLFFTFEEAGKKTESVCIL